MNEHPCLFFTYHAVILYPPQIPSSPPIAVVITERNEKALTPKNVGIRAPRFDPIPIPIQMYDFVLMLLMDLFFVFRGVLVQKKRR